MKCHLRNHATKGMMMLSSFILDWIKSKSTDYWPIRNFITLEVMDNANSQIILSLGNGFYVERDDSCSFNTIAKSFQHSIESIIFQWPFQLYFDIGEPHSEILNNPNMICVRYTILGIEI